MNKKRLLRPSLILLLSLVLGACAVAPRWPAISDSATGRYMPGRWVWMDLLTPDLDASERFYIEVFDWRFESLGGMEDRYLLVQAEGRRFAGMVQYAKAGESGRKARWLGLLSVADVASTARQVDAGGGATRLPAKPMAGRGEFAVLADPEGAVFAVIHAEGGDPPDSFPPIDSLFWMELWAGDAERMADFYRPIGGYRVKPSDTIDGVEEWHLVAFDYPRASVVQVKQNDQPSHWLPYVRVADLSTTLARVEKAGGRVLVAPSPEIRAGQIAVVIDPQGAALGLAEWHDADVGEVR